MHAYIQLTFIFCKHILIWARHVKTNNMTVRHKKLRSAWASNQADQCLGYVTKVPSFHHAKREDLCQAGTGTLLVFTCHGLIYNIEYRWLWLSLLTKWEIAKKKKKKKKKKTDEYLKVSPSHSFQWFIKSFWLQFEHVRTPFWFWYVFSQKLTLSSSPCRISSTRIIAVFSFSLSAMPDFVNVNSFWPSGTNQHRMFQGLSTFHSYLIIPTQVYKKVQRFRIPVLLHSTVNIF